MLLFVQPSELLVLPDYCRVLGTIRGRFKFLTTPESSLFLLCPCRLLFSAEKGLLLPSIKTGCDFYCFCAVLSLLRKRAPFVGEANRTFF